ncbi:MAG: deoxyguanosinetriphosphate triphosphohydrolase, partial [Candidatus Devosia euplotis]|nr:deoxyguanosinetriphosphate triphosphohydrolase [Candidatus Devosia euplotis]
DGTPYGKYAEEGLPAGYDDISAAADLRLSSFASLEAQTAAIADDIAYNAHDIDDALRAGLLALHDLLDAPFAGPIVRESLDLYPTAAPKRQAHEVQRRLITRSIEDVIAATAANIAVAGVTSAEDVRMAGKTLVAFSPCVAQAIIALKAFLFDRVYCHESVMVSVRQSEQVVADLFDRYLDTRDLPGHWGAAARSAQSDSELARIVADFIAGMTDPYALDEYARLFDARPEFR